MGDGQQKSPHGYLLGCDEDERMICTCILNSWVVKYHWWSFHGQNKGQRSSKVIIYVILRSKLTIFESKTEREADQLSEAKANDRENQN